MPNPWDRGSARLLASLGFEALATTSSGFAATLGRLDGSVTREEAISHGGDLATVVEVPISADLEQGFADDPAGVTTTISSAIDVGLAGGSVEDWSGGADGRLYDIDLAVERVAAAAAVAHDGGPRFVLTARAENYVRGVCELAPTIERLQHFAEAGADVLYAPGMTDAAEIRRLVAEVDRPVNVLARPGGPTVAELADMGVARVSVGGAFAMAGLAAVIDAATELQTEGTYGYLDRVASHGAAIRKAFD